MRTVTALMVLACPMIALAADSSVLQPTPEDLKRLQEIVNASAVPGNLRYFPGRCYYMRVTRPVDEPRDRERTTDQPRFIPLQSQSQARVRPLSTTVVCSNEATVRHAAR